MNKKRIRNIAFAVFFLIGMGITFYPMISSRWNAYRESLLVSDYHKTVERDAGSEHFKEMIESAQAYNQTLDVPAVPDAFSIREGTQDKEYESLLNESGSGMIGTVEIPAIKVNIPIYHYTTSASLEKGAGHLLGSALPVGGEGTHCVVSAHRGLPNQKLFTDLNLLKAGDVFYFHVLDQTFAYEVDQILTVEPSQVESLSVVKGEDYATLVTCTPYAVNTHRLLVRGHRVPYSDEEYKENVKNAVPRSDKNYMMMQALCVLIGIVIAVVIFFVTGWIGKRRKMK
ncbi:MAG: class C sortase [Lachnospiraceae bacterium]|jgi:sortase A|nr:class C sortase [Lachnospiraceae bacterium]